MKSEYTISRVVMGIIAFGVTYLVTINEEFKTRLILSVIFSLVTFVAGFFTAFISKKMISFGDSRKTERGKILFYILLLPALLSILAVLWTVIYLISGLHHNGENFAEILGNGIITGIILIVTFIVAIIPYLQTFFVLILRKIKEKIKKGNQL